MTNSDSNKLEIIKQKGVGKYFGECETNSEERKHELYVELCSAGEERYLVNLFANPKIASFQTILYDGQDKRKAEEIFNVAIERDKKIKQNLIHKIFNKN